MSPRVKVKCNACGQYMNEAVSCKARHAIIDGVVYERNSSRFDYNARCHDCGILNIHGNCHHSGCDMERCPKCNTQLITCDCNVDFFMIKEWEDMK